MKIILKGFASVAALPAAEQEALPPTFVMVIEVSGNYLRVWAENPTTGRRSLCAGAVIMNSMDKVKEISGRS